MADRTAPQVYSIAAHRGFADAWVAGLIPRYSDPHLGLARLTLLLPSSRAQRIVTDEYLGDPVPQHLPAHQNAITLLSPPAASVCSSAR